MHLKTLIAPRYWLAKLNKWVFERRFPDAPWLSESAVYLLDSWLRPMDRGIEWGVGRSSVWLASRVAHLTSVESDRAWYEQTERLLRTKGVHDKVDLYYVPVDDANDSESPEAHPYSDIVDDMPDESIDFALVDSFKLRLLCMEKIIPKIKPAGLLILDNSQRFFPNIILGEPSIAIVSRVKCLNERWSNIYDVLAQWREITTTNGVSDTRMWVKPSDSTQHRQKGLRNV